MCSIVTTALKKAVLGLRGCFVATLLVMTLDEEAIV
jgi:hypothetical protein